MKPMSLLSRCVAALLRLGLDPVGRPAVAGGTTRPQLELLEDRLTPSAPSLAAAGSLLNFAQPMQVKMAVQSPGPGITPQASGITVGSFHLALQQLDNGVNLSLKKNDQGMLVINVTTASAQGQSASTGGFSLSLVESPAVAEGTGAPGSKYLLVSILVPASLAGPPATAQSGPAPSDEAFAVFVPRSKTHIVRALGMGQTELFEVFAKDGQALKTDTETKGIGRVEERDPAAPTDASRTSTHATSATVLGDAEHNRKEVEASPTGQADEQLEEVFADPSFFSESIASNGWSAKSEDNPRGRVDWRVMLLAIPLALYTESLQRKSSAITPASK